MGEIMKKAAFDQKYYNIFNVCLDFRQRVKQIQRLSKKQQSKRKNVNLK